MKVDSNTKGNTYWFMFKVSNFRIGVRYTFNILNFTRSIDKFYNKEKMNIVTRAEPNGLSSLATPISEKRNQAADTEWRYGLCENILFEPSDIVRASFPMGTSKNTYYSYYQKLAF